MGNGTRIEFTQSKLHPYVIWIVSGSQCTVVHSIGVYDMDKWLHTVRFFKVIILLWHDGGFA